MADSDSDASFESADEGETICTNVASSEPTPRENKPNSNLDAATAVEDCNSSFETNKPKLESTAEPSENKTSGWGWGGWGSSLISNATKAATSSVGLFTEQLKQGLNVVMDTVEGGLGAPSPEEFAAKSCQDSKDSSAVKNELLQSEEPGVETDDLNVKEQGNSISLGRLMSGVSSLTGVLEQTGAKVIKESLDTLELFGRKTMDVLQEGDPGLKKTRAFLERPKTNLAQVLREAKDYPGSAANDRDQNSECTQDGETYFEEFQGLVHMEALEMLSKQCEGQLAAVLRTITESEQREVLAEFETVKQIFDDLDDDLEMDCVQDFEEMLVTTTAKLNELGLSASLNRLSEIWLESKRWLHDCDWKKQEGDVNAANVLYKHAIRSIQKFATRCMEVMHKSSELLLLSSDYSVNWAQEILNFTRCSCMQISTLATKYCTCLSAESVDSDRPDLIDPLITNIYLEASSCNTHIQNAMRLMLPIVQCTNPLVK